MTASSPSLGSTTRQLSLGLRWLDADDSEMPPCEDIAHWEGFLARADHLPPSRRLALARLWPLLGAVNGILALSGLLIWPDGSGIHLLLFLFVFWATPLLMVLWTALTGLALGRSPWWKILVTPHGDRVLALWFTRQSLFAQGAFCLAGLSWLWLILLTRQVIFYWGTSVTAVSTGVEFLFRGLGLGLVTTPDSARIAAAEAGAITGWEGTLLVDTWTWAVWLSQVMALWLLMPIAVLLVLCQWRLKYSLAHWPRWNHRLRLRYEQCLEPALNYRALQPEQPISDSAGSPFPVLASLPTEPGFAWQLTTTPLSATTHHLGTRTYQDDHQTVLERGDQIHNWYIAVNTVPTGELADLLQLHQTSAGEPRLFLVCADDGHPHTDARQRSWRAFLNQNSLSSLPVFLVTGHTTGEDPP